MKDSTDLQISVFYAKKRWLSNSSYMLICLSVGLLFLWSEVIYLSAGYQGNIPNDPISVRIWGDPDSFQYQYRLLCYFPFMVFFCIHAMFTTVYNMFFAQLIVGPEGVEYYAPGYRVKAKWQDVERVGKKGSLFWSRDGVFLKLGFQISDWKWFPINFLASGRNFIPIAYFEKNSDHIDVRDLINKYRYQKNETYT